MARNSAFGDWASLTVEEKPQSELTAPNTWGTPAAQDMLSQLNVAGIKEPSRDRSWERTHRGITYRGVPAALRNAIKVIAETYAHPADHIACAFLEYALACHRRGDLPLDAVLFCGKRTALHTNGVAWQERNWSVTPPPRKRKAKSAMPWKEQATYRLPENVIVQVKQISLALEVPRGEVVVRLLSHSLEAYNAGRLVISEGA